MEVPFAILLPKHMQKYCANLDIDEGSVSILTLIEKKYSYTLFLLKKKKIASLLSIDKGASFVFYRFAWQRSWLRTDL